MPEQQVSSGKTMLFVVLATMVVALLNLANLWVQIGNPNDTTTPESQTVYVAHRYASGHSIYSDYHQPPYNIAPYTPGYYILLGLLGRVTAASREEFFPLGRWISYIACLTIGGLAFVGLRKVTGSRMQALAGSALFWSSYVLWPWAATSRADLSAICLSMAGIVLYISASEKRLRYAAIPLFLLAFLIKQTSIAAPAAVILHCLAAKKRREAVLFLLSIASVSVLLLSAMHLATAGLSTSNIIFGNMAPMEFRNVRVLSIQFLQYSALPLILAAAGIISLRQPRELYLITACVWALFTSSKVGSNINYFIEVVAAACLLAPQGLQNLLNQTKSTTKALMPALALILLLPAANFLSNSLSNIQFQENKSVRSLIENSDLYTFTDNSRFALLGKDSFCIDPFQLSFLENMGRWDSSGIQRMLIQHQIGYAILARPVERTLTWQGTTRVPQTVIRTIQDNYRFSEIRDNYYIYIPRAHP